MLLNTILLNCIIVCLKLLDNVLNKSLFLFFVCFGVRIGKIIKITNVIFYDKCDI